eukprot:471969-Pyramimonas_sp.AAC.1
MEKELDGLGVRSAIVVGGDINSDLGVHREEDGSMQRTRTVCIGGVRPQCENTNGTAFRKFCMDNGLAVAT